jgi:hypothetical protein
MFFYGPYVFDRGFFVVQGLKRKGGAFYSGPVLPAFFAIYCCRQ